MIEFNKKLVKLRHSERLRGLALQAKKFAQSKRAHAVFLIKLTVVLVAFFSVAGILIPQYKIDESLVIKNSALKQTTAIVAGGEPIKYSVLVRRTEISDGSYLLKLPKTAKNISVVDATTNQVKTLLSTPQQITPLQQRESLAEQHSNNESGLIVDAYNAVTTPLKVIVEDISCRLTLQPNDAVIVNLSQQISPLTVKQSRLNGRLTPGAVSTLLNSGFSWSRYFNNVIANFIKIAYAQTTEEAPVIGSDSLQNLIDSLVTEPATPVPPVEVPVVVAPVVADVPAALPEVQAESVDISSSTNGSPAVPPVVPTLEVPVVDFTSSTFALSTSSDSISTSSYSGPSGLQQGELDPESVPTSSTTQTEIPESGPASSTDFVKIDFETPAPTITEENTDTGKLVIISDPNENPEMPMVDVLASTKIPPMYKVGQENKIHIKWKNNGGQNMSFQAYDTDSDGLLDYVEWTVPHLSDQIFEIIFISKAFLLDASQSIIGDIYEQVQNLDGVYATVADSQFVRVTFRQELNSSNDITIYARTATSSYSIEVYPVYTDADGNQTQGPRIATVEDGVNPDFSNIDHEGKYRILLSNLNSLIGGPTDIFDLRIVNIIPVQAGSALEIDYIVDPSPGTLYWVGSTPSWNTATNWSTTSGGAGDGWVPTSADDVVFNNGGTADCTLDVDASAQSLTMTIDYTGTLSFGIYNMAVVGNSLIQGKVAIGASSSTGWTTNNLTIGAGGTASSTAPGTIYYNQVTVSGTLSPDASGTYTVAGMWNGAPYYQRGGDSWYIYLFTPGPLTSASRWELSPNMSFSEPNRWRNTGVNTVAGSYVNILGSYTGTPTVANVTASGEYTRLDNSKITIAGNYNQSATSSKFLAASSLITVNGNGTFTADGTLASTQFNGASLVLNGTNTVAYNNLSSPASNGINNLITGQNGNTTTISNPIYIAMALTIGSGTLTGGSTTIYFGGNNLNVSSSSKISILSIYFYSLNQQTIPLIVNGYDCDIYADSISNSVVQTGDIVINGTKRLIINGGNQKGRLSAWQTDGYNLSVGGDLQIGTGADTGLKKLDATSGSTSTRNSTITVGGNWLNYGNGTASSTFIAASSTVIFNGSNAQTIVSGSSTSAFYNLTHSGVGTLTLVDNASILGDFSNSAGIVAIGTNNLAVTGNSTVANATTTIGISASTGWTTNNLTIGAGGTASSTANGTIYYNQVTVSGTLSPDAIGTYTVAGIQNGVPYYKHNSLDYWLHWNGSSYWYISTSLDIFTTTYRWARPTVSGHIGTYSAAGSSIGIATVANVTASGEYTRLDNSKITIAGNYDQSATSSKFLAASSLITVNGNGTFTANGTLDSTQYNNASLVLNGVNTLTYGNLALNYSNGFNNLIVGQSGSTTTLASTVTLRNQLTIGSGALIGGASLSLYGATPLNFNVASVLSINLLYFNGGNQTIPTLVNGYNCNIWNYHSSGQSLQQTGDVVINAGKSLYIGNTATSWVDTWKTDGYNLTVGGNLQIGYGNDTGLKKLDATSGATSTRNSIITVSGNWLNYGNGTAPSQFIAASSTVIFNSTTTGKTITSGATNSPFNAVQFNGEGGAWTLQDNLTASSATLTNGTLIDNAKTVTVNGDILIANTVSSTLTSTGSWIQGASGNLSNAKNTNSFKALTIAGSGVTTTLTGNVWVGMNIPGGGATTMGPGTLRQSANSYALNINPRINDAITVNNLSAGSQILDLYIVPTAGFTQKSITLPDNFVSREIQIDNVWGSWMASGDWNFGNNNLTIFAETANVPTLYTNMGTSTLTAGALKMGFFGGINHGYLKLGSSANHSITSISRSNAGATSNIIDFGSSSVAVAGNVNFTGIAVTAGSSTVILTSTSSSAVVTSTGQSFYNLTFNGSGGTYTLADNASVLGNLNVTAGTLAIGVNNLSVTGNSTITNATTTIGVSSSTGWTTNNLTIGAGGTASSTAPGTIYYNQVTVVWSGVAGSPDCTGTYVATGMRYGKPYYRRGSDNYYLYWNDVDSWVLTDSLPYNGGGLWAVTSPNITGAYWVISPYTQGLTVANVTASGEYTRLGVSKITIAGNYDQSSVTSKFLAASSLITVSGNGTFTADGTLTSTQCNGASLVLNGVNTLSYSNLTGGGGFNNLTVGQNGSTTTLGASFYVVSNLSVGSGSLTGSYSISLSGPNPLTVDTTNSVISINSLIFRASGPQSVPALTKGYDCSFDLRGATNQVITQTGNITLNDNKILYLGSVGGAERISAWKTDGYNLTVGGNLYIGMGGDTGLKSLNAVSGSTSTRNSVITVGGNWLNYGTGSAPSQFVAASSTVIFNKISGTQTLNTGANSDSSTFYNLTHSGAGTLQLITNPVTVTGDFTNSGGTFDANGQDVNVAGNWDNTATFLHGTSTVNLIGAAAQAIMGTTTFYNLVKTVTTAATLTFEAAKTQVIAGALTLQGVANQLLSLVSSIPGASWFINPLGSTFLNFLNISDAVNTAGTAMTATNSKNLSNNTNITFSAATTTWTGASSTDWNTAGNWDLGYVPNITDNVIIASASNQPVLSTSTTVNNLTVNSGATLAIGIYNLTVTGNSLVNGTTTIGASASAGWSTTNLTIGAGGTASSTAPGTIYYNQVTVTGTLSPDATGTYTVAGMTNGYPYYKSNTTKNDGSGGQTFYYLFYQGTTYYLSRSSSEPPNAKVGNWYVFPLSTVVVGLYNPNTPNTGNATVANVTASGEYTRLNNSKITISGNYDQSSVSSKFLAGSSLITVNGSGTFMADGTLDGTQYNGATIALNGTNTLAYVNISRGDINGFNNLIVGQNGNTVTFNNSITIKSVLTIGSGSLTGSGGFYLSGSIPLSFDTNSRISITGVVFSGTNQILPPINNGYDCGISIGTTGGTVVTQTGNVVINSNKILSVNAIGYTNRAATFYTNGYNLTVGGNLQIGAGSDSVQKSLDATSGSTSTRNSIITVGGNWLNYGNGTAPSQFIAASSTVVMTGTGASGTITSGSSTSAFNNLTINGTGGTYTLQDNATVAGALNVSAGTLAIGANNLAVTGASTINGTLTLGTSSSTGWTTGDLNLGASGTITSNATTYYNQVTVSGTLSPDATGTYTVAGIYNGYPYYRRGSDNWYIWHFIPAVPYWIISPGLGNLSPGYWIPSPQNTLIANYGTGAPSTGIATVANVTASGIYYGVTSDVTISGNYTQTAGGYFNAGSSLITQNGNGNFTADGNNDATKSAQFNNASLVLNGTNTLSYNNLLNRYTNGFNNLMAGQSGNTSTLSNVLAVKTLLTIGSGTLTGNTDIYLRGATPLSFDANSHISVTNLRFYGWTVNQSIPTLANGYDSNILVDGHQYTITQTGNITLNSNKSLTTGNNDTSNIQTWNTSGYNLTVGGNIQIGWGSDTGLKKIDATGSGGRNSTIIVGGNWINYGNGSVPSQFVHGSSTVVMTGTSASGLLTSGATNSPFYNLTQNGTGTTTLQDNLVVAHDLTLSNGTLDTKSGSNYSVTIGSDSPVNGSFTQSTSSRFMARSSVITLNGDGSFTANGTVDSTQYNGASLVLNGTNYLVYTNVARYYDNDGFYNLTVGQNNSTTTLGTTTEFAIGNILAVGSGTLTGPSTRIIYLTGTNPLSFTSTSRLSVGYISLTRGVSQNIPSLINGYDCNISTLTSGTIINQTGNIILNAGKSLYLNNNAWVARTVTWNTLGYDLSIGGSLQIGTGADSGPKTLNAVSASTSTRNSIITVGGNWTNYGNGTAPSQFIAANSTVIFNSTTTGKSITSGATNSAFNDVQFNGVGGIWTLQDPLVATGALTHSAGTLNPGGQNITTAGNLTITDGALVAGSGLNSSIYYNQVTVSGSLSPDVTGVYTYTGVYNSGGVYSNLPYWSNGSYYLWHSPTAQYRWIFSPILGDQSGAYWVLNNATQFYNQPSGVTYTPFGTAVGVATIGSDIGSGRIGSRVTVGGNFSASGNSGTLLTLNPTSTWYLNVSGTANANYVNVANSNASGGSAVTVSNSTDSGSNTNWSFDLVAPTTTATAVANSNPYTFSTWTNSGVTVTLDCVDNIGGSGCASGYPKYCLDTDNTCTPTTTYVSPITISSSSETYILFYSVDARGNTENVASQLIQIDKATPVISNLAPATGSTITKSGQTVTFTTSKPSTCRFSISPKAFDNMASDYSCSVANSIQMTCALPELSYGTQNIYFACEDYLGNQDTSDTVTHASYNVPQPPSGGFIFWPVTPAPVITLPTTTSSTVVVISTTPKVEPVITINKGTKVATKPKVIITLTPTPGTTAVIISTNPDFSGAVTLPFVASPTGQASFEYDLCQGETSCLNQSYTVYTKFLDASGNDSPAFSANINLKLPSLNVLTISIGEQIIAGISNLLGFFKPISESLMNLPSLTTTVPKETPLAFQNRLIFNFPAMNDFMFAALPLDFMSIANKFPQIASALKNAGITRMGDAGQLEVAKVSLPGLAEAAGLSGVANLAIADLTKDQTKQVPTNMVFARGGNNNLDLNVNLSISNQGTALQTLNTIQGHPLTLAIKPDQPAMTVKGYLIFKSNRVGEANASSTEQAPVVKSAMDLFATPVSAMEMQAEVNVGAPAIPVTPDKAKETPDLVLAQFNYKESENGIWTADVASPLVLGQYELRTVVEYKNKEATPETVSMVVIVDPEGYVFRKLSDGSEARITNAVVSIYWLNPETKQYELWPAMNFRQENPQTTDVTGRYAFLVPPGDYYLTATAGNYGNYQSEVFKVEENKGVFMNLELKATASWLGWLNIQNILLGGILLVMVYFAVLFTVKRKRVV